MPMNLEYLAYVDSFHVTVGEDAIPLTEEAWAALDTPKTRHKASKWRLDRVRALANNHRNLMNKIRELKADIVQAEDAYHANFAKYKRLKEDLAEIVRIENDSELPAIVWVTPLRSKYVVEKVTKNTIFVRQAGCSVQTRYRHDGSAFSRHSEEKIDIEKTFPNGLTLT